jgi:hypothetical protein
MQQHAQPNRIISVSVISDHERAPRKYTSGRVCAEPYCGTRLSVYNGREYCSLHRTEVAPRTRGTSVDL